MIHKAPTPQQWFEFELEVSLALASLQRSNLGGRQVLGEARICTSERQIAPEKNPAPQHPTSPKLDV